VEAVTGSDERQKACDQSEAQRESNAKSSAGNLIRKIASSADSIGPKAPRSPMLIEHCPSHLN
jgi:hypothetical protein